MHRQDVNQALLDRFTEPSYLEIGVDQGVTFDALKAARKVAVDPRFAFDVATARANPANAACEYHEMTSDDYFLQVRQPEDLFDLIFVDGLHTFDQTLKDLLNATAATKPDGIIIVDDVIPNTYAASLPDLDLSRRFWSATNNPDGSWMGDVFRLVFFVRSYMPFFRYATVAENHGQMIMWHANSPSPGSILPVEQISRLQFPEVVLQREVFNLRPFADIVAEIWPVGGSETASFSAF